MNKKIKEIALQAGGSHYPEVGGATLEKFTKLLLEECITAVKNTDTTHAYTTFDKGMIDSTITKCVNSIKKTFDV
jgi:uncharacterized protein YdgA (DUF945 family)